MAVGNSRARPGDPMRALIVEDDRLIGDAVATALRLAGYAVDWVTSAEQVPGHGVPAADVVVLDIALPGISGLDLLARWRADGVNVPVLLLTARDTVVDRVDGLDRGGDDYLIKPFDLDELLARVRSLVRRGAGRRRALLEHRDIVLDPAAMTCSRGAAAVVLTRREFAVLELLLRERGRVLSRDRIEDSLYAWGDEIESNAVQVHIHHLRRKFGEALIRTVRGAGYIIDPP